MQLVVSTAVQACEEEKADAQEQAVNSIRVNSDRTEPTTFCMPFWCTDSDRLPSSN